MIINKYEGIRNVASSTVPKRAVSVNNVPKKWVFSANHTDPDLLEGKQRQAGAVQGNGIAKKTNEHLWFRPGL